MADLGQRRAGRHDAVLRYRWTARDPDSVAAALREGGVQLAEMAFRMGPVTVELSAGAEERLVPVTTALATENRRASAPSPSAGWAVLAVAYATVDTDRFVAALQPTVPEPRPRDGSLGGSAVLVTRQPVPLVVLEPDTEGRLAAMLARHGEGPVGLYVVRREWEPRLATESGPFGTQRLFPVPGRAWVPVLIRVAPGAGAGRASTIDR